MVQNLQTLKHRFKPWTKFGTASALSRGVTIRASHRASQNSNVFGRRERRKGKADFRAMARAVQTSTRPDFAPGESGMGTSLCPSVLRGISGLEK
jgi:hypothetical protein